MYLVQMYIDLFEGSRWVNEAAFLHEHDAKDWMVEQEEIFSRLEYRVVKSDEYLHNITPEKESQL